MKPREDVEPNKINIWHAETNCKNPQANKNPKLISFEIERTIKTEQ